MIIDEICDCRFELNYDDLEIAGGAERRKRTFWPRTKTGSDKNALRLSAAQRNLLGRKEEDK